MVNRRRDAQFQHDAIFAWEPPKEPELDGGVAPLPFTNAYDNEPTSVRAYPSSHGAQSRPQLLSTVDGKHDGDGPGTGSTFSRAGGIGVGASAPPASEPFEDPSEYGRIYFTSGNDAGVQANPIFDPNLRVGTDDGREEYFGDFRDLDATDTI